MRTHTRGTLRHTYKAKDPSGVIRATPTKPTHPTRIRIEPGRTQTDREMIVCSLWRIYSFHGLIVGTHTYIYTCIDDQDSDVYANV